MAVDLKSSGAVMGDGFGEELAFSGLNAGREGRGGVIVQHRDCALKDDRAAIVLFVDKVNRTAGEFDAGIDGGAMHSGSIKAGATEGREQGRVNVDNPASIVVGDWEEAQESGEDDEVGAGIPNRLEDGALVVDGRLAAACHHEVRNSSAFGTNKGADAGTTRDHLDDLSVEAAIIDPVNEVLESRTAPGSEDSEADRRLCDRRMTGRGHTKLMASGQS